MKRIAPFFFILAAGAWYAQQYPSLETWNITFIEWNQKLPIPIWSALTILGVVMMLGKKKVPSPPTYHSTPKYPTTPKAEIKHQENPKPAMEVSSEWKEELVQNAMGLTFPRGGKIAIDPQKDTPFVLKLPHKTHQSYKDSINIFAQWLASTPTPKRVLIRFDAGCSEKEQQLVRAAFRKHYHINEMMIRKEANQIDILFHHPDQNWGRKYNLNKDFL